MRGCLVFLIVLFASCAACAGQAASHVTLKVEQPVFAGLPVWLDVVADDPCIGVHYSGDLRGSAQGGWAEIKGPGDKPAGPGFRLWLPMHRGSLVVFPGACPSSTPLAGDRHGIPLHLIADLRAPGDYAVRWHVPTTTELGDLGPSDWVKFTLQPSTSIQREAWLTDLLAHQPTDLEGLRDTYVPSLLAEWDNPRAMRRLLDLLCTSDPRSRLSGVFGPVLSEDAQIYLATLIAKGCLSEQLIYYLKAATGLTGLRSAPMPEEQRNRLLQAVIIALPKARTTELAYAIEALSLLGQPEHDVPAAIAASEGKPVVDAQHDAFVAAANAAVMRAVPTVLAGRDDDKLGSSEQPKWALTEYMASRAHIVGSSMVLEALAAQADSAAGYAIMRLIGRGDPTDLPFLHDRLMGDLNGVDLLNIDLSINSIPRTFGPAGIELLHALLQARTAKISALAAVTLAVRENDRAGMMAIVKTLQGNSAADKAELLNGLLDTPVCASESEQCHLIVTRDAELQEPEIIARKTAAIAYFENKLGATK